MGYGNSGHIFNRVGWVRGPTRSVAYCTLCPASTPFVVAVSKADRRKAGNALAAAQAARAKVAQHIREKHPNYS